MKQGILLSAISIGLFFTACKKDKTYDASGSQPGVSYKLTTTNKTYAMAKTTATANIVWTAGYANPSVIKFEAKKDNTKVEFTSNNTQQIDLMAPTPVDFGGFTIPAGTYKEIELSLKFDKNGGNAAMELDGQFTLGAVSLPITVVVTGPVIIKTEQHDVDIISDNSFDAVTTIDLLAMTSGITADALLNADLTNGVIVISASSNRNIYNKIVDNFGNKHHHCKFEHHHH